MPGDGVAAERGRRFELTSFLLGRTKARGIFEDRFGKVRRRFSVDIDGQWQGREFVLSERFRYDDGSVEQREWRVAPGADGRFTASSPDCVGVARGRSTGDSIRMSYDFRLRLKSREIVVSFDDRIHRVDERTAINRAFVYKWGFRIGEVTLVFTREDDVVSSRRAA